MRLLTNIAPKRARRQDEFHISLAAGMQDIRTALDEGADAVVLNPLDARDCWDMLTAIRTHALLEVSLLPVFIHTRFAGTALAHEADGTSDGMHLFQLFESIRGIAGRVERISNQEPEDLTLRSQFRLAAYLFSRGGQAATYASRKSHLGLAVPYATMSAGFEQTHWVETCTALASNGYADVPGKKGAHGCNSCSSTYLNFKETCPSCGSTDLEEEPVVHHFPCAHVGPMSQFVQGDDLVCPKCTKTLRHIGIDYDKPSAQLTCHSCNHSGQQTGMQAECIDCGTSNKLNELKQFEVPELRLNQQGIAWVENGVKQPGHTTGQAAGSFADSLDVFHRMVEREQHAGAQPGVLRVHFDFDHYTPQADVSEHVQLQVEEELRRSLGRVRIFARTAPWTWEVLFSGDEGKALYSLVDRTGQTLAAFLSRTVGSPATARVDAFKAELHS